MERVLKLYTFLEDGSKMPFPKGSATPLEITEFSYSATRMGKAPSITFKLKYPADIEHQFSESVGVDFNDGRYYVDKKPASSYSGNLYEYDVKLVSDRAELETVYFYDIVSSDAETDRPVSNSSDVKFSGDLKEAVRRINMSLEKSNLDFRVYVDDGVQVDNAPQMLAYNNQYIYNVLLDLYEKFKVPFYFSGGEIHFGEGDIVIGSEEHPVEYGIDKDLKAISKEISKEIYNRCSAYGSNENIPYYYPNDSPYGTVDVLLNGVSTDKIKVVDWQRFSVNCGLSADIRYLAYQNTADSLPSKQVTVAQLNIADATDIRISTSPNRKFSDSWQGHLELSIPKSQYSRVTVYPTFIYPDSLTSRYSIAGIAATVYKGDTTKQNIVYSNANTGPFSLDASIYGPTEYTILLGLRIKGFSASELEYSEYVTNVLANKILLDVKYESTEEEAEEPRWYRYDKPLDTDGIVPLYALAPSFPAMGLSLYEYTPSIMDTITFKVVKGRIPSSTRLLPSIYRETNGEERFYNAENDKYTNPDTGEYYSFTNPYTTGKSKEYIYEDETIKPSITNVKNALRLRIDQIDEFSFDLDDNDDVDTEGKYIHPLFYAKLRKFDGPNGFNLFSHVLEGGTVVVEMTSGSCSACKWTVKVNEDKYNTVQVQKDGSLKRDSNGNVIYLGEPQDVQNDTEKYSVWIALEKEENTFGVIMPNATNKYYPSAGDSFVFTGVHLPKSYITAAEKKLEQETIRFLAENNEHKISFSTENSRIFLAENPEIARNIRESAVIYIKYASGTHKLFVNQYSYSMSDGEALPKVTIDTTDELPVRVNAIEKIAKNVTKDYNRQRNYDFVSREALTKDLGRYVNKYQPETIQAPMLFRQEVLLSTVISSEDFSEEALSGKGWSIRKEPNDKYILTVDKIVAREELAVNKLVVNQVDFQRGTVAYTKGGCTVTYVEEFEDFYRCYFDNKQGQTFSGFTVGDLARCTRYDYTYSDVIKYYWRRVDGVTSGYVDLSKTVCDGSGIPEADDHIVQLGNTDDKNRQNAIFISPDNGGSVKVYSGINGFSLDEKDYVALGVNPDTNRAFIYGYGDVFFGDRALEKQFITYQIPEGATEPELHVKANITLGAGSTGLSNLSEFQSLSGDVQNQSDKLDKFGTDLEAVKAQSDKEYTIWFFDAVPTNFNEPAVNWSTDEEKAKHDQDMYYSDTLGRAWRWELSSLGTYSWNEITDAYTIEALAKAQQALDKASSVEQKVSDLEFLKYAFPDAVLDSEGVILSKLMAVKDGSGEDANVVAGIYGGDSEMLNESGYQDATHGTLMMFAGAPSVGEVSESDFKVYEDGYMEARTGAFSGLIYNKTIVIDTNNFFDYFESTGETNNYKFKSSASIAGCNLVINDVQADNAFGNVTLHIYLVEGALGVSSDVKRQYLGANFSVALRALRVNATICAYGFCLGQALTSGQVGHYTFALNDDSDVEEFTFDVKIKTLAE